MSDGYKIKSCVLQGTSIACAASSTTTVSNVLCISAQDSHHLMAKIECSAMAITNDITFKWQDSSGDGTWTDVGNQSETSGVKKTFTAGTAEVFDAVWPATAAATQGDNLSVRAQDGTTYDLWLDIDAAGVVPTGALYLAATNKIKVSIITGGTAAQNAAIARAAVVANAAWVADFTTSAVTVDTFTVTHINGGGVINPVPKSSDDLGAGSITISVTTAGTDGGVDVAGDDITSSSHGFATGAPVIYVATSPVGGLTSGTTYYVIVVDANTLALATTQIDAFAGTAIAITSPGIGTHSLFKAIYEIRMTMNDATDAAQLPLLPLVRCAAVTDASDTCTVSNVYFTRRM